VSFLESIDVNRFGFVAVLCAVAAYRSGGPKEDTTTNVRPRAGGPGVSYGDCAEALRRAVADPDLDVDSVPRPVTQHPRAFAGIPAAVKTHIDANGATVKVDVVVDTLDRADMKTFKIVGSSHPWLGQNLMAAIPSWRFRAARLAGCKVPRIFHFSATSKPRG